MPTARTWILVCGLIAAAGCAGRTEVADPSPHSDVDALQDVFGPTGIKFERRELLIDLNGDGIPERVVLLANEKRGLQLPRSARELITGDVVDGFAVFDGRHPATAVFYQYPDYDGYSLRWDDVDGQRLLVSDGGRDHMQYVWGWWSYPDVWPVSGWEARARKWNEATQRWCDWTPREKIFVFVSK